MARTDKASSPTQEQPEDMSGPEQDWKRYCYEMADDWGGDEDCDYCEGDGGDPLNDYALACPTCGGEG